MQPPSMIRAAALPSSIRARCRDGPNGYLVARLHSIDFISDFFGESQSLRARPENVCHDAVARLDGQDLARQSAFPGVGDGSASRLT